MAIVDHSIHLLSRREALMWTGTGFCGWTALGQVGSRRAMGQDAAADNLTQMNRFPRMVQDYYCEAMRRAEEAGDKRRAALKTKADAQQYVKNAREKILAGFGPLPEKTPLNVRTTGVLDRDVYKVEKLIFESRPGFLVTGNLYLPKGRKSPMPAVLGVCGHELNAKAAEPYQSFSQGLARMGYVVLIFDPIGQGERLQYKRPGAIQPERSVDEHLWCGNQQSLLGEFFGAWRAWDAIRAMDYLLSRPEVDPRHVGVTGNSGGGTMTTYMCGIEPRLTMAAPSCWVTSYRRNMENELPGDIEQCLPRAAAMGLEQCDYLAASAPKPIIICAQERDFFDIRGTLESYGRLKHIYRLLGAEENIGLVIGPYTHGYSRENREAMYRWFNRAADISQESPEPKLVLEKDEALWCTPNGQVSELKSRTVFSFTRAKSQELTRSRGEVSGNELKRLVKETLKLPTVVAGAVPSYRNLPPLYDRKYPKMGCATYAVQSEPGIFALVHLLTEKLHQSRPTQGIPRAVLYVAHMSSDAEMRREPLVAELVQAEPTASFYACDLRGVGDSQPNTCGVDRFLKNYGSDYFYASQGMMLDKPYIGQRTFDLLQVLTWLEAQGHKEVHLAGKGWGALTATFAAVLSPVVVQVTLKNALPSYTQVAETETYRWPLSAFVPDVLHHFDLPDCYRALAAKNLRQIEPWKADEVRANMPV